MSDSTLPGNSQATASSARPKRALRMGGGPAGYVENALKAVAEPFRGITATERLFPVFSPSKKRVCPPILSERQPKSFLHR